MSSSITKNHHHGAQAPRKRFVFYIDPCNALIDVCSRFFSVFALIYPSVMALQFVWYKCYSKLKRSMISGTSATVVHVEQERRAPIAPDNKLSSVHCFEQSPIDIDTEIVAELNGPEVPELVLKLGSAAAEIVKDSNNFTVFWVDRKQNYLMIDGKVYYTVQFHFHTPSEHTIDGKRKEMEFHLVNQAEDGSLAVVGLFFRVGTENKFLSQFWSKLSTMDVEINNKVTLDTIAPTHLELFKGEFYRYRGSLTTPPYSEGVEWVMMKNVAEASAEQIDLFYTCLGYRNARDVQALNKREVHLYATITA